MPDKTSRNRIYTELRRSIIMGHRLPGERLDVEKLAENYGTSVTPIRDALQMLSEAGLVTIRPRSGYFVTRITLKQLRDLLELREIIELASVERAAVKITDGQLAALEHVHRGYTGDDDESYDRYTEENRRFHCLIAEASGNMELAETLGRLHDRLARLMVICRAGKSMEITHARIVEALRAHDVEAARQALLSELMATRATILEHLIQEEGEAWHLDM
ncbi:MAG: GntR family transcriptional regulator [Anaerolineae bacterium]|nr:GntR family transcriptional regulator [Anaerolineae bacterium]